MKIFAFCGSLQAASSNRRILEVAHAAAPAGVQVDIYGSLAEVPAFNPDLDTEPGPPVVADLRAQVAAAGGVLIATPEYAYGMPGSLKNALDWLVSSGDLYGKGAAILCGSPRSNGGTNAREMLERTLHAQGARVLHSSTVQVVRGDPDNEHRIAAAVDTVLQGLVSDPRPEPSQAVH
jgi:NAD(P)H-dependent FMN reductase